MCFTSMLHRLVILRSLKSRLIVGLLVALLLLAGLVLGMAWQVGKSMVNETNVTHLNYEAQLLAGEITQQIAQRFEALERLGGKIGEADRSEWLSNELGANDALLALFEGIIVANAEGQVIADWPVVEGRSGLATVGREYFKMLEGTRQRYVSEPFVGRVSDVPMVLMGVPRLDQAGNFIGFIGGIVSLDSSGLFKRLATIRLGDQGYAAVATASGTVLYHPARRLVNVSIPETALSSWLELALDGWQGSGTERLLSGKVGLQAYAQVWPASWIVGLYVPLEQAQLPLSDFIYKLWWIWVVAALLLMPLVVWLLTRIISPLDSLETQIGEVGGGSRPQVDLNTRMLELQRVATTFNRVAYERQQLFDNLQERELFLDLVLHATPQGMFVADFDGTITFFNPALLDIMAIEVGMPMEAWLAKVHADDRSGAIDMWRHSLKTGSDFIRQLRFIRNDEEVLWLDIHARVVMLSPGRKSQGLVGVVKDITERREQEALQRWEVEHDPLTNLLNRRGFGRRLEEAFADFSKTNTPSALLMFDLDHFKPINDEGGHALGDDMLRLIAQATTAAVRRSDHVARQGGDEFGVLLPSCTLDQAQKIAEALRLAVSKVAVMQQGKTYNVTLSIGITRFEQDDTNVEEVLFRADAASYQAKGKGRNTIVVDSTSQFN